MEKLRIHRNDILEIEVNDKGETIIFDVADVELPLKFERSYNEVRRIQSELKGKLIVLEKQKDVKNKGSLYSKNEKAAFEMYAKAFKDMRRAMDGFLGEGACEKIFGKTNYLEMYDDLINELSKPDDSGKSIIDKLHLTQEDMFTRIKNKYGARNESVLKVEK